MNILLTYAGGIAAQSVVKSIRNNKNWPQLNLVGVDCDPYSCGLKLVDKGILCPPTSSPSYKTFIEKLIKEENIDLFIPTGEEDLSIISSLKNKYPTLFYMSDLNTINLCQNKWEFYNKCKDNFDLPETYLEPPSVPYFEKPIYGRGSRGTRLVKHKKDIIFFKNSKKIYQEYIPGQEWSVDVLSNMEGKIINITPRKRLQTKSGISTQGKIELNKNLIEISTKLVKYLNLKGPSCIQFKEDKTGNFKLIEVNVRFGGGVIFTTLAGVNQPEMIIKDYLKQQIFDLEANEVIVSRFYNEMVI
tara:strand:- start:3012 stop:3917 length:906 start_codon:yes stop_codon:yes gene_type:complete